jgi:hypothetical protein
MGWLHVRFILDDMTHKLVYLRVSFLFSPANHHFTIAPYPSITAPWSGNTLSHLRSLRSRLRLCCDTYLNTEQESAVLCSFKFYQKLVFVRHSYHLLQRKSGFTCNTSLWFLGSEKCLGHSWRRGSHWSTWLRHTLKIWDGSWYLEPLASIRHWTLNFVVLKLCCFPPVLAIW